MGQKRKRLALSCVDCRRRKVKCDRAYPICIRCQKSNNAENCSYVSHTGLDPGIPTPSDDSPDQNHVPPPQVAPSGELYVLEALREMSPHMEVQSRQPSAISEPPNPSITGGFMRSLFGRGAQLEAYARSPGHKPVQVELFNDEPETQNIPHDGGVRGPLADFSKVMVRGQSFSTHYYGPSFAISMLLQFEELSKFVKGMLTKVPSFADIKDRMAATRKSSKGSKQQAVYSKDLDLTSMVPDRSLADKLVEQYISSFETTYRILHVPTFRRNYEAFWQNHGEAKQDFVVVLLLVMASVYTIVPGGPEGFLGRGSARREVASRWISTCESWLGEQSHKHITLTQFQAHILVFLGKCMNCIKIKREWTATGQLLRFAMAIGMHREPSLLSKKIDVFDQEMRRRLWFTILELDLLTTIARGMPPTIDSFSWDCQPPRNINDEDFDQHTTQLPPSKDRSAFTRSSFLHIATESLSLRVEVLGRINSIRLGLDLEAVMQYDTKLRSTIDKLPSTWRTEPSSSFATDLSRLLVYDYILILHVPFATSSSPQRSRAFYSIASKRDISFKTLQIYSQMPAHERLILFDTRDDYCRATLALAHDIVTGMNTGDLIPNTDRSLAFIETVVDTATTRFNSLGQGFHTFWITLSAFNLLRWKVSAAPSSEQFSRDAADRVAELFNGILDKQVPTPLMNGDMPSTEVVNAMSAPSAGESLESFDNVAGGAFAGFDSMGFYDDPFADMNFDISSIWNLDGSAIGVGNNFMGMGLGMGMEMG